MSKLITKNDLKAIFDEILPMDISATAIVAGSTGALYFYRYGNIVYFSSDGAFRSKSTSIANNTTLTQTVPSGFRPVATAFNIIPYQSGYQMLQFGSTGSITYFGAAAWNSNAYVSGMWITNDPMPS